MQSAQSVLRVASALLLLSFAVPAAARAQDPDTLQQRAPRFTAERIDSLVAPVALYPDPVLAQVLVAATFTDQIEEAAAWVRANGTRGIDDQGWDVSVKAVAHYPTVLNRLAEDPDWTTELGQAYAAQSGDVMDGVQRMRALAQAQGNLPSTKEQQVVVREKTIIIEPAEPTVVYVPTYDPWVVYYQPVFFSGFHHARFWSFGIGFRTGSWLNYDCDWYGRRVFYHGWDHHGWRGRSRPFIHLSRAYVNPSYRTVAVNRDVLSRPMRTSGTSGVNRSVFWDQTRNGPIVHRGGEVTTGGSQKAGGRTIFPQDIRRDRAGSTSDYRDAIRPSSKGSAPIIYRGPSRTGAGSQSQGSDYRSARMSGRPSAGGKSPGSVQGGSGGSIRYGGSASKPSKSSGAPSASRPSSSSRGFGTITPSKPSGRKP